MGVSGGIGRSSEVGHVDHKQLRVESYVNVGAGTVGNGSCGDMADTGILTGCEKGKVPITVPHGVPKEDRVVESVGTPCPGSPTSPHAACNGAYTIGPSPPAASNLLRTPSQESGDAGVTFQENGDDGVTQMGCSLLVPLMEKGDHVHIAVAMEKSGGSNVFAIKTWKQLARDSQVERPNSQPKQGSKRSRKPQPGLGEVVGELDGKRARRTIVIPQLLDEEEAEAGDQPRLQP
jgi:hypothetical protein